MTEPKFVPLQFKQYPLEKMKGRAAVFLKAMKRRRSVRSFCGKKVPRRIIEDCIKAAATAPSGANKQPWHFCVVSDPDVKREIRLGAEKAERGFYTKKAPKKWLEDLKPLGTDFRKPFLEAAPYLIVVFSQRYGLAPDGSKIKHYYVTESVGIAAGILITAIHNAGLATVPYTPAQMGFLNKIFILKILNRPENEKPFCILPVGYPTKNCKVPFLSRKSLNRIATFV